MTSNDSELRKAFAVATVELLHLAARCQLEGRAEAKQQALDGALFAFMKRHQREPVSEADWQALEALPVEFPLHGYAGALEKGSQSTQRR